jgi:biopolymer transport protein ExbD
MGLAIAAANHNRQTTPVASINTTPLVDVMLVLLIIFMIAAPLFTHKVPFTVPVGVPPDKVVAPPPEQTLTLVPNGGGVSYLLDGEALAGSSLPSALRRIATAKEETRLNLVVDPAVAYADVATVLALARQSGVEKMGFDDLKGVSKR